MDYNRRADLKRYGAPAAFLVAVTIAVLLIKSALGGGDSGTTTTAGALPTAAKTTSAHPTVRRVTTTTNPTAGPRYYTIQSGDTLGAVAFRLHMTVDDLLRLNPGVDPKALHTGQRIRVG